MQTQSSASSAVVIEGDRQKNTEKGQREDQK